MTDSRAMLIMIGQALYGPHWVNPMAADLGVARETVRRWKIGSVDLPPDHGIFNDLCSDIDAKLIELVEVRDKLKTWLILNRGNDDANVRTNAELAKG